MKTVCGPTYVALAYNFILFRYFFRSHTYTLVRFNLPGASLRSILWQQSLNTFTVQFGAPNFSIICIGSESCLGSIVGFARLPCFGTLRSAISAKVALGELLQLCPGSAGLSTSVEKAKTDCHDKARDWSLFERFQVPKDLCRLERGTGFVRPRRG